MPRRPYFDRSVAGYDSGEVTVSRAGDDTIVIIKNFRPEELGSYDAENMGIRRGSDWFYRAGKALKDAIKKG